MKVCPDEFILRLYNAEGVYIGPAERTFDWFGETINIDDYAAESGLVLPDAGEQYALRKQ